MPITIDHSVETRWSGEAVLGVCVVSGCQPVCLERDIERELDQVLSDLRARGRAAIEDPRMQAMRATFRAMPNMDPTRYRSASESLLRRFQEKGFFRINPLVDVNNLLSTRLRIPLGIYDLDRVPLDGWLYRLGAGGEKYVTLSGQEKSADGKLVLADKAGILGSPVSDTGRAPVGRETKNVAVVGYLPFHVSLAEAKSIISDVERAFAMHFSPERTDSRVVLRA